MKTIVLDFQVWEREYDYHGNRRDYRVVKTTTHTYDESKTSFRDAFDVVWEDALNQGCDPQHQVRWTVKDAESTANSELSTLNV